MRLTPPASSVSVDLSRQQIRGIRSSLDTVSEWVDDHSVDRLSYYFDGEFSFSHSDAVYYFSYECNVIYYDHYFAEISAEEMQFIQDIAAA